MKKMNFAFILVTYKANNDKKSQELLLLASTFIIYSEQ